MSDFVTNEELQQKLDKNQSKLDKIAERVTRLERYMIVIACAVASPKLGGPNPTDLATVIIGLFS